MLPGGRGDWLRICVHFKKLFLIFQEINRGGLGWPHCGGGGVVRGCCKALMYSQKMTIQLYYSFV